MSQSYELEQYGYQIPPIPLEDGNVLSIITDDGPTGYVGQCMSVTCPHTVIHWFANEDQYRAWGEKADIRNGKNVQERVVVVGQWSAPGVIRFVKHDEVKP